MSSDNNNEVTFPNDVEEAVPQNTDTYTRKTSSELRSAKECASLSQSAKAWDIDGDGELDETELALRNMDTSHKGNLSKDQLYKLMHDNLQTQRELFKVKKIVIGLVVFTCILALCNLGTSFAAAFLAKDMKSDEGKLVDTSSGRTLKTDSTVTEFIIDPEFDSQYSRLRRRHLCAGLTSEGNGQSQVTSGECALTNLMAVPKNDAKAIIEACESGGSVVIAKTFANGNRVIHPVCNHLDLAPGNVFNYSTEQGKKHMRITKNGQENAHTFLPSMLNSNVYEITGYSSSMGVQCDFDTDCGVDLQCFTPFDGTDNAISICKCTGHSVCGPGEYCSAGCSAIPDLASSCRTLDSLNQECDMIRGANSTCLNGDACTDPTV